jgi:hypothetical protein
VADGVLPPSGNGGSVANNNDANDASVKKEGDCDCDNSGGAENNSNSNAASSSSLVQSGVKHDPSSSSDQAVGGGETSSGISNGGSSGANVGVPAAATNTDQSSSSLNGMSTLSNQAQSHTDQAQTQQQQLQQSNDDSTNPDSKSTAPLRRGKWTIEEEQYANRLIHEFKAGLLPLTDGTTLRTFLSRLLNCDPMRISKKFVGSNCIGKQVFRRRSAEVHKLSPEELERTRLELCELERMFLDRLAQNASGKGGGGGRGGSGGGSSRNSKMVSNAMPSLGGGGGVGGVGGLGGMSNTNKSAAALGRAMLQGKNGAGGLLAQMQSQNQMMFPTNPATSFLSLGSQAGGLGERT